MVSGLQLAFVQGHAMKLQEVLPYESNVPEGGSSNDESQLLFIVDIFKFITRVHGASLAKAVPTLFGECSGHHRNVRVGPLICELTC
jgi:hypothetical protein